MSTTIPTVQPVTFLSTLEAIAASPDALNLAVTLFTKGVGLIAQAIEAHNAGNEALAQSLAQQALKLARDAVTAASAQMPIDNAAIDAEEDAKFPPEPATLPKMPAPQFDVTDVKKP